MSEQATSEPPPRRRRRLLRVLLGGAGLLVLGLGVAVWVEREPLPTGSPGPEAEALADRIEAAVNLPAWKRTRAVRWTFADRNRHLWDRARGLDQVRWSGHEVLLRLKDQTGRAWTDGAEVTDPDAKQELLQHAWAAWCNDSFWLNPLAKLRDPGTTRSVVDVRGGQGLLLQYASGGVTPGDSYVWIVGDDGLPTRFKMWVSILPIGGVDATWGGWITLETGARISTAHTIFGVVPLRLTDVAGAATLEALLAGAPDPFARLGR